MPECAGMSGEADARRRAGIGFEKIRDDSSPGLAAVGSEAPALLLLFSSRSAQQECEQGQVSLHIFCAGGLQEEASGYVRTPRAHAVLAL